MIIANSKTLSPIIFLFLFFYQLTSSTAYYESLSPTYLGFGEEKLTHLRFYFHEVVTDPNPSVVIVAMPVEAKPSAPIPFGTIVIIEDPLTVGPELDSKLVGKAQGFYTSVTRREGLELELVMGMTLTFTEGKYNGSTLSVLGRNAIVSAVREMPIIGGTGAFRFARGFVQARTLHVDYIKGDATVEYNVYVFHYLTTTTTTLLSHDQGFNHDGVEFMIDPLIGKI